ncbi:class A beta-lactamase [Bradyrhizobium ontarionense]|uniref:Beta-lactamase n=1 Tax=Bradyrhizobium ontarionense TaxID=2898149 RepID=A0ABY3RGU3_9BRAD|nr:class A beta-lactamase [Bradyrhizobium sp. A19]UFZ05928.1 class A beta-lactamase [Bradyrhizobium sp. A19]
MTMYTRRQLFPVALAPLLGLSSATTPANAADLQADIAEIEAYSGARLGVALLDTASGSLSGHRLDERFAMCSTFKALLAAAVLAKVDVGTEQLARRIPITQADILAYAPVTKIYVGTSGLSVAELCEAAVTVSDNTAANLLLATLGGPAGLTRAIRAFGDAISRLDRTEPDLNEAKPGDVRDTTTPAAMAQTLATLTTGHALSAASRDLLTGWMIGCQTGGARLRAGLPKEWRIGDKTGTGAHGSSNDVAVIWPAGRAPVIVSSYLTESTASDDKRNAVHAAVGRAVATALGA